MASISTVTSMGYGSWGSAALVVTLGYGSRTVDTSVDEADTFRFRQRGTLCTSTRGTLAQAKKRGSLLRAATGKTERA